MTYTLLREIADSWVLLAMTLFFVGCGAWAWRPGSRRLHDEAASLIFSGIDARPDGASAMSECDRDCATCACNREVTFK